MVISLNELLSTKKPSKLAFCEICKAVNQKEREATSKCVECQKLMCRSCVATHQQMKITMNHSVFELEIEKDVMCKQHPNEQVRFYCEPCEMCVCVPCTYTDHRDHELVDFKDGISLHKEAIEENLRRCRQQISDIRLRLDALRQCETKILYTQNEIHSAALSFIELIRQREASLIEELNEHYGPETLDYLKKKDELDTFHDQLKSTCNLTDMVVKGNDIEMLLLKKQLCEKFDEFQEIKLDSLPKNISKKVTFVKGSLDFGHLEGADGQTSNEIVNGNGLASGIKAKYLSLDSNLNGDLDDFANGLIDNGGDEDTKTVIDISAEKATQIFHRDFREIMGAKLKESEVQTDIRMIHELQAPNKYELLKKQQSLSSRTENKEVQTDATSSPTSASSHPPLTTQSSVEEDPNAPIDRNKLGKRVRRHVKPGCSIAVLPSSEIIIIDPESNLFTVLDKRGKFRFGMSNSNKSCNESGHPQPTTNGLASAYGKLERGVRIVTPQGNLLIKLESEPLPQQAQLQVETTTTTNAENNSQE